MYYILDQIRTYLDAGTTQKCFTMYNKMSNNVAFIWNEHLNVFILQTIVSWIGSQANIFEKQKVREIATLIRDTDRHGKAQITNINEGEETQEMLQVTTCQNTYCWTLPFIDSLALQFSRILVQSLVDKSDISSHSFLVLKFPQYQ